MMDFAQELAQAKVGFDLLRTAIGAVGDARDLLPKGKKRDAVTQTLEEAAKAAQIAEATVAQALGYELCRCEFPPTPMLRVGHRMLVGTTVHKDVDECPKCRQNNAGDWAFTRKIEG